MPETIGGANVVGFTPIVLRGSDGLSVTGATIDGSGHLIITLSDASTIDAGAVTGGSVTYGTTAGTATQGNDSRIFVSEVEASGTLGGTNDSSVIQTAVTAAQAAGKILRLRPGVTYRGHGISVPAGTVIDARGATVKVPDSVTASNIFTSTGAFTIIGGTFDGNKASTSSPGAYSSGGNGVYMSVSSSGWSGTVQLLGGPVFQNFWFGGVVLETDITSLTDADNAPASAAYLDRVEVSGGGGVGIRLQGVTDVELNSPYVHGQGSHGIRTFLCKRQVTRNARCLSNPSGHGMTSLYCVDQRIDGQFDSNGTTSGNHNGLTIGGDSTSNTNQPGRRFLLGRIIARLNGNHGLCLDASKTGSNLPVPVYGSVDSVLAEYNAADGVIITSSQYVHLNRVEANHNTAHGLDIASANVSFGFCRAYSNGQKGIALQGSAGSPNWGNHRLGITELSGNSPDDTFTYGSVLADNQFTQASWPRRTITGATTAKVGEVLGCDTTSGTFAVTLPEIANTVPGRVHVKWVAGSVAPTLLLTGTDKMNLSTSSTVPTFSFVNHGYTFESDGKGLWTIVADTLPVSSLDARYAAAGSSAGGLGIYGDASDGSLTFDGSATVLGMVPSSNVYTLTRDIFCVDITINSGVTINPNLYRIFHTGTLTNNGSIKLNGGDGGIPTGGTGISRSTASINNSTSPAVGIAGSNGGFAGAGTAGVAQSGAYSLGGISGAGGTGASGGGGASGTNNPSPAFAPPPRSGPLAAAGYFLTATSGGPVMRSIYGGAGGGGGGGDATHNGGGGGAGGGVIIICGKAWAGTGVVQARGGAGASMSSGNVGGGGGGGGGAVLIVSGSVSAGAISGQTIDANGGAGGTKNGTGTNGTAGSNGTVILVPN